MLLLFSYSVGKDIAGRIRFDSRVSKNHFIWLCDIFVFFTFMQK